MEQTADEIKRLQGCINDLISVLALPALWSGYETSQIVSTLLDVLLGMLRLDFVYVRLSEAIDGTPIEAVRLAQHRNLTVQPQEVGRVLTRWLTGDPPTSPLVVPNPIGEGEVSIAPFRLGLQEEVGVLVAGSWRADFPTEIEKLLLRVAANQAAIGLQEARRITDQNRTAEELEQQVVERTRQLTVANEELRREILERKRAEQRLSAQYAVTRALAESDTLTHATPHLLQAIGDGMEWEWGALWIVDREAGLLRCQSIWHARDIDSAEFDTMSRAMTFTPGRGLPGHVWQSAEPTWIADATQNPHFVRAAIAARVGLCGAIAFPVLLSGETLGVVEFFSRTVRQPDEEQLATLSAIGSQIGQFIERKRAEAELRESESRYRHIFQMAGVSIWEEDFSQVKAAIDDLKAQGVRDFRQYLATYPEFVQQAISMVKIIDVNDTTVKLFEAQRKDELLVSLHKIFLPETQEVFTRELIAIAEGRTNFESETVLQTLKGDKRAVLVTITFPPQPAKLDSVLVTLTDLTERKHAEEALRKAQVELAHVTRVMTMGELAASIAHEVNQPLAAVVTNGNACLRWLAGATPNLDEAREAVGRIIRDGKRAGEVIGRIRALVKKSGTEQAHLDLNEVIREVVGLTQTEIQKNGVALRMELAADLPPVVGDRVQLQQVFLNLVMNGIEAMSAVTDRARELVICSHQHESDQVFVAVQDSGIGIDRENLEKIFNAFYTTKSQGMGMGLAISRSIVENHGGRLWAVPHDGPGATLQFTLLRYH